LRSFFTRAVVTPPVSYDLQRRAHAIVGLAREVFETAQNQQLTFLAAAVAYYMFVSLVPLLALVLAIGTSLWGEAAVDWLLAWTDELLTPDAQELLSEALSGGRGRVGATVLGTIVVLWSGLRVFRGIDKAFAEVYGTGGEKSLLGELRDGLLVLLSIGLAITAMTVVSVALRLVPLGPFAGPFAQLLVFSTLAVVFLPVYYVFPDRPMTVRDALPGAIVAALGWTILGALFGSYVALSDMAGIYGPLGGLLLLVTLLYAGSIVLLLGTVVNAIAEDAVRTGKYNSADLQDPNDGIR
jgi:YihY family inner membrane protein